MHIRWLHNLSCIILLSWLVVAGRVLLILPTTTNPLTTAAMRRWRPPWVELSQGEWLGNFMICATPGQWGGLVNHFYNSLLQTCRLTRSCLRIIYAFVIIIEKLQANVISLSFAKFLKETSFIIFSPLNFCYTVPCCRVDEEASPGTTRRMKQSPCMDNLQAWFEVRGQLNLHS